MSPVVYVGPQSRALALASETPDAVSVLAVETPDAALLADARVTAVVADPDAAVDANRVRDVEAPLLTTSGSPLPDAVVDERLAAEGDPVPALVDRLAMLVDTTPARRERALRRQNERLDRFADVVSHDLQTPIQLALTQLELYRDTGAEVHLDRLVAFSAGGSQVGLAIAAEVAEAHSWSIGVTESDAGGARFEITGVSSLAPV